MDAALFCNVAGKDGQNERTNLFVTLQAQGDKGEMDAQMRHMWTLAKHPVIFLCAMANNCCPHMFAMPQAEKDKEEMEARMSMKEKGSEHLKKVKEVREVDKVDEVGETHEP
eukprot:1159908-Pelagomonas_calceolata.AAC.3